MNLYYNNNNNKNQRFLKMTERNLNKNRKIYAYRSRMERPQPPQQWSAFGDELSVGGSSLSILL